MCLFQSIFERLKINATLMLLQGHMGSLSAKSDRSGERKEENMFDVNAALHGGGYRHFGLDQCRHQQGEL